VAKEYINSQDSKLNRLPIIEVVNRGNSRTMDKWADSQKNSGVED